MSLDFNISKIQNKDTLCYSRAYENAAALVSDRSSSWYHPKDDRGIEQKHIAERLSPVTQAIIFATISVDIGEITSANAVEFFTRIHAVQTVLGPLLRQSSTVDDETVWIDKPITFEDIQNHIGLTTNVRYRSWFLFWKRLGLCMKDRALRVAKQPTDYTRCIDEAKASEAAEEARDSLDTLQKILDERMDYLGDTHPEHACVEDQHNKVYQFMGWLEDLEGEYEEIEQREAQELERLAEVTLQETPDASR